MGVFVAMRGLLVVAAVLLFGPADGSPACVEVGTAMSLRGGGGGGMGAVGGRNPGGLDLGVLGSHVTYTASRRHAGGRGPRSRAVVGGRSGHDSTEEEECAGGGLKARRGLSRTTSVRNRLNEQDDGPSTLRHFSSARPCALRGGGTSAGGTPAGERRSDGDYWPSTSSAHLHVRTSLYPEINFAEE